MLSVCRERDNDVQNALSCELCAFSLMNFVDMFYPDGAMRHTAKRNLLNEIEIKKFFAAIFNTEF